MLLYVGETRPANVRRSCLLYLRLTRVFKCGFVEGPVSPLPRNSFEPLGLLSIQQCGAQIFSPHRPQPFHPAASTMSSRVTVYAGSHTLFGGIPRITCFALLTELQKARATLGIPPRVNLLPDASALPAGHNQKGAKASKYHSPETYWAAISRLGWVTTDEKVLTEDDVEEGLERDETVIPIDDVVAWLDEMVEYARSRCPALRSWGAYKVYSLIALGQNMLESALAEPDILNYTAAHLQNIKLEDYLGSGIEKK